MTQKNNPDFLLNKTPHGGSLALNTPPPHIRYGPDTALQPQQSLLGRRETPYRASGSLTRLKYSTNSDIRGREILFHWNPHKPFIRRQLLAATYASGAMEQWDGNTLVWMVKT